MSFSTAGFRFDATGALMVTTTTTGATRSGGFLRSPLGELVVVVT